MTQLGIFAGELIGTFILVIAILQSGNPFVIAAAFLAAISIIGALSGGHINPIVTIVSFFKGSVSMANVPIYFAAQLAGGLLAYFVHKQLK
jgi:glycerol uptake facilitator-like aquaporin